MIDPKWAADQIESLEKECSRLRAETAEWRAQAEAYQQAKAENDERFMIERDEARHEVEELRRERDAAVAKTKGTYCAYCGKEYPLDDAAAVNVTEHIRTCPAHPLRAAEAEIARIQAENKRLLDIPRDHMVLLRERNQAQMSLEAAREDNSRLRELLRGALVICPECKGQYDYAHGRRGDPYRCQCADRQPNPVPGYVPVGEADHE